MLSFHQKVTRYRKKQESITHSKEKKKKKESTETIPEKDQIVDLLGKDVKTAVLKVLRELQEMDKVKKTYEQNGNINEEIENKKESKSNFGTEMYGN